MISSTNENYKELAWRILQNQQKNVPSGTIRHFKVPKLNIQPCSYVNLIDWKETPVSEPVFTASITMEKIKEMISKKFIDVKIPALPCHTQSVERHIKLVTEAASSVVIIKTEKDIFFIHLNQERQCRTSIHSHSGILWSKFQYLWLGGTRYQPPPRGESWNILLANIKIFCDEIC